VKRAGGLAKVIEGTAESNPSIPAVHLLPHTKKKMSGVCCWFLGPEHGFLKNKKETSFLTTRYICVCQRFVQLFPVKPSDESVA
jgi:hypothetical protein